MRKTIVIPNFLIILYLLARVLKSHSSFVDGNRSLKFPLILYSFNSSDFFIPRENKKGRLRQDYLREEYDRPDYLKDGFLREANHRDAKTISKLNGLLNHKLSLRPKATLQDDGAAICRRDVFTFLNALRLKEKWALQIFDSYGKPPSGILKGNLWWTGSYSQCINAIPPQLKLTANNPKLLNPKYCWIEFQPGTNLLEALKAKVAPTLGLAVCVPDTCDHEDIRRIVSHALDLSIYGERYINVTEVLCLDTLYTPWTDWKIISRISFMSVLCLFLLLGTLCDLWLKSNRDSPLQTEDDDKTRTENSYSPLVNFFMAFSVYSNARRTLKMATRPTPGRMNAISAIRVLALLKIILTHFYFVHLPLVGNVVDIERMSKVHFGEILGQVTLPVDVFFLISGLLLSYNFLNEYQRNNGKISWLKFYVHRYIRITAPYFFMAWFMYGGFGSYVTAGPLSFKMRNYYTTCENYLWRNMLYINNWFPPSEMCFGHGWYLTVDVQLFVFMPIILIPLAKSQLRLAWSVAGVAVTISAAIVAYLVFVLDAPMTDNLATTYALGDRYDELFQRLYAMPYFHMGVYMVGITCGWWLQTTRCVAEITKSWLIVAWASCILILLCVFFAVDIPEPIDLIWRILYNVLGRTIFAAAIAWIIFACACGFGGFINTVLSHRFWMPLSRLSYCTYICHIGIMFISLGQTEIPLQLSHFSVIHLLAGQLVFVFGFGFILVLMCEEPVTQLEQIFLFPRKQRQKMKD